MRQQNSSVLLMTATITPQPETFLLRHTDPQQRREDYRRALTFYMEALKKGAFTSIVFAENSGSDLTDLRELAAKAGLAGQVSFVAVERGPVGQYSRCYLELDLLNKAFASDTVAGLPGQAMIWKVTGRYIIRNIVRLVDTAPDVDVYVNSRNYPVRCTDLYLLAFRKRLYPCLLGDHIELYNNVLTGEEIFRTFLDDMTGSDFTIRKRLLYVPTVEGTRGYDRGNYDSASHRVRRYMRAAANRMMPGLWI